MKTICFHHVLHLHCLCISFSCVSLLPAFDFSAPCLGPVDQRFLTSPISFPHLLPFRLFHFPVKHPLTPDAGENEKLDLAIYSKRSIFAAARRLRNSPRATTNVAEVEFLQLLGLLPGTSRNIRASLNETWVQGEGHAGEGGAIEEVSTA